MPKEIPIEYREIRRLEKENKELQQQLHEYKLAATAEADKVDELSKENDDLREQLHKEVFRKLQAQPNALKASEVKPKPLSKQKIEEIVTDWHSDEYGTIESLAEAIYLTQGEEE